MARQKRILTVEEKDEQKRIKAAKGRVRAQLAFSTIFSTMRGIAREEVCNAAVDLWKNKLNMFRKMGEKVKIDDFLALSPQVDPFNADDPTHRELAEWFVAQWQRFRKPGATTVHVRGLHYNISGLAETPDAVYLPNGTLYDNTNNRWNDLQRAGKYARYLGLIRPEQFQDRRSRKPVVKEFKTASRSLQVWDHTYDLNGFWLDGLPGFPDFPDFPDFPSLPRYWFFLSGQQRYRVEVWIEKSTQEDVIQQVCEKHQVTSVTAQGEISITAMWDAIHRAEQSGDQTTTIILYASDFDPAGRSMPVAASRKLEFARMVRRSNVKMRLYPIVLTHEQCIRYKLPRTPLKESDKRKEGFEYRYGSGATELDALEALHPGELGKLVEASILRFRDDTITSRVQRRSWEIDAELRAITREVHAKHGMEELEGEYEEVREALDELQEAHERFAEEYADLKERYDRVVIGSKFDTWQAKHFGPFHERLLTAMRAVSSEMYENMPDINDYEIPEAKEVPLDDDCLYDSTREYVPQLAAYKQFAGKFSHLTPDEDEEEDESAA